MQLSQQDNVKNCSAEYIIIIKYTKIHCSCSISVTTYQNMEDTAKGEIYKNTTMKCEKSFSKSIIASAMGKYFKVSADDFDVQNYQVSEASEDMIGFQGDYYRITVNVKLKGDLKQVFLFVKSLPDSVEKANKLRESGYFSREINVYTKVFPQFQETEVSQEYHTECLYSSDDELILEDLDKKGFRMTKARNPFDKLHSFAAITSLAKFHASSLITEEIKTNQNLRQYRVEEEFHDFLNECGYKFDSWYTAGMNAALAAAGESTTYGKSSPHYETVKHYWMDIFKDVLKQCCPSETVRNVICHRDLWANNLMFIYNDKGEPTNCLFVDFQACRCMPPAGDLMSLIYLNYNWNQRQAYLEESITHYYETLGREMSNHGLQVQAVLPWLEFREMCNIYKKWALVQCALLHQLALLQSNDANNVFRNTDNYDYLLNSSRSDFIVSIVKKDTVYRERYLEYIDEIIKMYIITGENE